MLPAAVAGFGLAASCMLEDQVADALAASRLVRVLEIWCEPVPGYHLHHPSRRQTSPAFSLRVEALRYRG